MELVPGAGVIVGNKTYSLDEPQKIGIFKVMSTTLYTVINFLDVTVYWSGGTCISYVFILLQSFFNT